MAAAAATAAVAGTEPVVIPRAGAGELVVEVLAGEGAERAPQDEFSARMRASWSEAALRVRVEVRDRSVSGNAEQNPLRADGVELHLRPPGAGRWQAVATRAEAPVVFFDYREAELRAARPAEATVRREAGPGGTDYAVNFEVPWAQLGRSGRAGMPLELRVVVNDGDAPGGPRALRWGPEGRDYVWDELVAAELGETAEGAPEAASWGGWRELARPVVHVVARAEWAGREIEWRRANGETVRSVLAAVGAVSVATLEAKGPTLSGAERQAELWLRGERWRTVNLGDVAAARARALRAALQGRGGPAWLRPELEEVFDDETPPLPRWRESEALREAFGEVTASAEYFNAAGERVERAAGPGRVGMIATVKSPALDRPLVLKRTLYRRGETDAGHAPGNAAEAVRRSARAEGEADAREAARVDRAWWHRLEEKLGTETRYPRSVLRAGADAPKPEAGYPLIVFLHGSGGGRREGQHRDEPVWRHAEGLGEGRPFVLVSLRSAGGWLPPAVVAALRAVMAAEPIDPARVYLTGFSMGGVGTWETALDYPELFAAIAPVGGADGEPDRAGRLRTVPALVINGKLDYATTSEEALKMVNALRAAGGEARWLEYPHADHGDSLNLAYGSDELYAWLLAQRRAVPGP